MTKKCKSSFRLYSNRSGERGLWTRKSPSGSLTALCVQLFTEISGMRGFFKERSVWNLKKKGILLRGGDDVILFFG
jgi:hypothetical protein